MNGLQRDKCAARRIARAGCVDALRIVRVTHRLEAARPLSNAERVSAWRTRSNVPGFGGCYIRPYKSMPAPSNEHRRLSPSGGEGAGSIFETGDC